MSNSSWDSQEKTYQLHIREVMQRLGLRPMDLVRKCGVGVATAYRAARNSPDLSLDVAYTIYNGLKAHGYDLQFEDIVTVD